MSVDITIAVHDPLWTAQMSQLHTHVKRCIDLVFEHQAALLKEITKDCNIEVAAVFTHSREIQELNRRFRGQDKPTNVLSFSADMDAIIPEGQSHVLGDIILSYQVIEEEAKEQHKPFSHHATHMIIHGLLHLLGYDHIYDEDAEVMEAHERDILKLFNIADPYQLRESQEHAITHQQEPSPMQAGQ